MKNIFNQFEHLSNGITIIYCENTKEGGIEEVYIDTHMFNYINSFKVEWKVWRKAGKKIDKYVGGTDSETGKILNLRRIVGEYINGLGFHFSLLNEDYFDIRNGNVFNFKPGTGHSGRVRKAKENKLANLPPLEKKEDIEINSDNNNVQIIEYEDKVLMVENQEVVFDFPDQTKYRIALSKWLLTQ